MLARKSLIRVALLTVTALVTVLVISVPGQATTSRKYDLTVSPSSVAAGTTKSFEVKYTNKSTSKIMSTELKVPTGFHVSAVSTSRGTLISGSSSPIKIKDLYLSKYSSFTVTVTAKVPCSPGTSTWTAITKTGNFSGSLFSLNNPGSAQKTTVTGSCSLAFVDQPTDTGVGEVINDPDGVSVRALDGAGNPVAGVNVSVAANGPGGLNGDTQNPTDGDPPLARFTDLSVDAAGTYTLSASASGFGTATSDEFDVAGQVLECNESYPTESGGAAEAVDLTRETGACVVGIPVTVAVRDAEVEITKPFVEGSAFTMSIEWVDEAPQYPIPATRISYTGDEGFHDMELCLADGGDDGGFPDLPEGEFWCVTDQSFSVLPSGRIQVTESYFGAGDPRVTRG